MKYLYSILIIALCLFTSCKSDSSSKVTEVKAVDEIEKEVAEVGLTDEVEEENLAIEKGDGGVTANEKKVMETKAEVKAPAVVEAAKKVSDPRTPTKEVVKEVVKETKVVTEKSKEVVKEAEVVKEKSVETSKQQTKIIEPNLKVTVPIDQGRKPAVENKNVEVIENVDLKKNKKSKVPNKPGAMNIDHSIFHKILRNNVSASGIVDYKAIKADASGLDTYLSLLSKTTVSSLSKSEQLAFWVNAYNAFTIKKVVSNYPIKSIKDLNGGKPWDDKWINLDGKSLSLNDIENSIIRPQFNEPRIHFAVNCAAQSCPPISNTAYSAGNLNTNMEKAAKAFINNNKYNKIAKNKIVISKIFDWYKKDFGDIITYLNKYSDTKIDPNATVEYMEYDWNLNSK